MMVTLTAGQFADMIGNASQTPGGRLQFSVQGCERTGLPVHPWGGSNVVRCGDRGRKLTKLQFELFAFVFGHSEATYEELRQHVWGGRPVSDQTIEDVAEGVFDILAASGICRLARMVFDVCGPEQRVSWLPFPEENTLEANLHPVKEAARHPVEAA